MGLRQRSNFDGILPQQNESNVQDSYLKDDDGTVATYRSPLAPVDSLSADDRKYVFGDSRGSGSSFAPHSAPEPEPAPAPTGGFSTPDADGNIERPMVFVMRSEPNMYVYEFSNRLEYYRRSERGMIHCSTQAKKR